jgi:hypothetical protein
MSISVSEDLFEKLRGQFPNLSLGREDGVKTLNPQEATFFEFQYKNKRDTMGSVVVSLVDEGALKVYFNERMLDEADQESHDGWYKTLKNLSKFATQNMLSFETNNITKQRLNKSDYEYLKNRNKPQEELTMENKLYGTSNKSYQDLNGAKLIVQHKSPVDEEKMGARSRNINAIYIENAQGERFRFSNNYLPGARAMARHVGNGGYPNDQLGEHIEDVMAEMSELKQFVRTVKSSKYVNEDAQDIIETATDRYYGLKDTLKSMTSQRGYVDYFEAYEPSEIVVDEDNVNDLKAKLTREVYDERLDGVLPAVGRAVKLRDDKRLSEDEGLKQIGMSSEPLAIYPNPEKDQEMDTYIKFIQRSDLPQERKTKALLVNVVRMLSDRMVDDTASVALSRLDLEEKGDRAVAYKLALKFLKGNVNIIEPKAKKDLYGKDHAKEDTFEEFEAQLEDIAATVDEGRMSDIDIEMHEEVLYMSEEDFVEKYSKYASEKQVRNFWNNAHNEFTEDVQEADNRDAGYPDDSVKIGKKHWIIYKDRRYWYGYEVDKEGNQIGDVIFDPRTGNASYKASTKSELIKILAQESVDLDEGKMNDELDIGADEEWDMLDPDWETKHAELDIGDYGDFQMYVDQNVEPDAVIGAGDVDEPGNPNAELDIGAGDVDEPGNPNAEHEHWSAGIPADIPEPDAVIGAGDVDEPGNPNTGPDLDSMSFGKAFAAARKAHGGSGGMFTWKGKQYQTNVKGEKYVTDPKTVTFGSTKESFDPMSEQPFSAMSDEELADYLRVSVAEVKEDRDYAEEMAQEMANDNAEYGESIDRMKNLAGL